ncbi:MAG: LEVG family PEP-CTERM protein [Nostocaceae cyanobacterium]|nr:LEVG family PEP-CTERM protein [Nostocaceae cyanobacterium]
MSKFNLVAATLFTSTLGLSIATGMSAAHASSLVPQQEGEVKLTNVGCIVNAPNCIDTHSTLGYTVTSKPYDYDGKAPQYGLSRLFVDNSATANDWVGISFPQVDAGTNPPSNQYWFRPVAYLGEKAESLPTGTPAENSNLEVGQFKFVFDHTISELKLNFLDVEDKNFSGILKLNGAVINNLLPAGLNNSIQSLTLKNVDSFVVQLGKTGPDSVFTNTGDGVDLQISKVPEPTNTVGLVALIFGILGLRRNKKVTSVA